MNVLRRFGIFLLGAFCLAAVMTSAPPDTRVADAAMRGDRDAVRALLKQSPDSNSANAAQGDGMTALHWAASKDDAELAAMLLSAGASAKAVTRIGAITPLWLAAQNGDARIIEMLLKAGADPNSPTSTGVTALMVASAAGSVDVIKALLDRGADLNAKESNYGQTPLIFASAFNRPGAIVALIEAGAKTSVATKPRAPGGGGGAPRGGGGARGGAGAPALPTVPGSVIGEIRVITAPVNPPAANEVNGEPAPREATEAMGGLTPLLYAVRQDHIESVRALLDHGAAINEVSADRTTPLMMAVINGHFDLAMFLLEHGGDPKIATVAGGTPLYRAVDVQWAPKSFYPQPSVKQERVTYLELMKALLAHGADPNARLTRQLWYTGYGFELEGVEPAGATAFWRASEVGDLDAMKLLVAAGADPKIATNEGVTPLLVAAGDGFHGNDAVTVPAGRMPAVKYLVEECHADVNALDTKAGDSTSTTHTNTRTYTPVHAAAARGDNEMILYLVAHGARVDLVGKNGVTTADIANSPRERIEPFPETVKLLESLGAKNSHKCIAC
ncbi:MAG TPA: ankyrin repeat domain-containing protein [Bryobacteraceae bacterium]|nr:ankyrin repeat domain-containing protein [Bryobacteraceae bacterium]